MTCPACDKALRYPRTLPQRHSCHQCGETYLQPDWMADFSAAELDDLRGLFELLAVQLDCADGVISQREAARRAISLVALHSFEGREPELSRLLAKVEAVR